MMVTYQLLAASAALCLALSTNAQGMYGKSSAVLQVDAKSFNKLINKSNQVSIVEFYAPWCGHCQSLKPKYEKAAKNLKDLAQVAAVDCDDDSNKPLCASMGVKGFPTLKIVKPSKKPGKPIVEDYQGPRESSDIVETVKRAIPNNVKRVTDKGLTAWLENDNTTAKAVLFSDKATTSALTKVLANDFKGTLNFGQIRDKEATAVDMFGISDYPTLLVLPGGADEPLFYSGAFTKAAMKSFLSEHASPVDKKPLKEKIKEKAQKVVGKEDDQEPKKPASEDEESFTSASSSQKATETPAQDDAASSETLETDDKPTESPEPAVTPDSKPIVVNNLPDPIPTMEKDTELSSKCLGEKTSTCVLALLPALSEEIDSTLAQPASLALASLAEIAEKHRERKGNLFPFYAVPAANPGAQKLRTALKLDNEVELIAVNGRRAWYRRFGSERYDSLAVETWIDNIRFGEGAKGKLADELITPEGLVVEEITEEDLKQPAEEEAESKSPEHGEL